LIADFDSVPIYGLNFACLGPVRVVNRVFASLREGRGGWLLTPNLELLRQAWSDPEIAALYRQADLTVADGVPILWAAKLLRMPLPARVAGSDLVWLLSENAASNGRRVYLLGGKGNAGERASERLKERWPDLEICGRYSPRISNPPTDLEIQSCFDDLERARPHLVYVALGSPKTEYLIAQLRRRCPDIWFVGVGISLSFIAGTVERAPIWMQRFGLEWLHRLSQEPARLGRRYLALGIPFALRLLFAAWLAGRARRDRIGR